LSLSPPPLSVDVSIISQSVTVRHHPGLSPTLIESTIEDAGFDIASAPKLEGSPQALNVPHSASELVLHRRNKHLNQCTSCKIGRDIALTSNIPEYTVHDPKEKGPVPSPIVLEHGPYSLMLSVGGMTCAACSSTVTRLVSEIGGVLDVAVDLIGHSAKVIAEDKTLSGTVVETIKDAGYDAEIVKIEPHSDHNYTVGDDSIASRTISLRVDGMFCQYVSHGLP
jgi:P-type Cu+ transporter